LVPKAAEASPNRFLSWGYGYPLFGRQSLLSYLAGSTTVIYWSPSGACRWGWHLGTMMTILPLTPLYKYHTM